MTVQNASSTSNASRQAEDTAPRDRKGDESTPDRVPSGRQASPRKTVRSRQPPGVSRTQDNSNANVSTADVSNMDVSNVDVEDPPVSGDGAATTEPELPTESETQADDEEPTVLTEEERKEYRTLKGQLRAGEAEKAEILWEIKNGDLYREEYDSFKDFCVAECSDPKASSSKYRSDDSIRRHYDRIANWGRVRSIIGPNGPSCEAHARPLTKIKNEDQICRIWEEIQRRTDRVTKKDVEQVVSEFEDNDDSGSGNGGEDSSGGDSSGGGPDETGDDGDDADDDRPDNANPDRPKPDDNTPGGTPGDGIPEGDTPGDDTPGGGSDGDDGSSGDPPDSQGSPKGPDGGDLDKPGFYVYLSTQVLQSVGLADNAESENQGRALVDFDEDSDHDLSTIVSKVDREGAPLTLSSTERGIADAVFHPLLRSLDSSSGTISDAPDPERVIFRPERLGRIQSKRNTMDRVLVSPQVDLFAPVVPDEAVRLILSSLRSATVTLILCTTHLDRAQEFSLPSGLWLGAPADRSNLQEVDQALGTFSTPSVRWILYDVQKECRTDGLPSSPSNLDWVVYDPPGGAGVSLRLHQGTRLKRDAEEAGIPASFRCSFKTFEEAYPDA